MTNNTFSEFPPVTVSTAQFGVGTGPIWLSGLQCTGQEETLSVCSSTPSTLQGCTHEQDAAVICDPPMFGMLLDGPRLSQLNITAVEIFSMFLSFCFTTSH